MTFLMILASFIDRWNSLVCKLSEHEWKFAGETFVGEEFVGNPGFGVAVDDATFDIIQCSRCGKTESKFVHWGPCEPGCNAHIL
jgi:hypothetical protein